MVRRWEMLDREIELAASRAREPEERDLAMIAAQHAERGVVTSGMHVQVRHDRRLLTLVGLVDHRLQLERETPMRPEDEAEWYTHLEGGIHRIIDEQRVRLLAALDEDGPRFGGGPIADSWREQLVAGLERLRMQYLTEAALLRDKRLLKAGMPERTSPSGNVTLKISHSSIANLNLGQQIGQIQNSVGDLQQKGLQEIADALKALIEALVAAPQGSFSDSDKRQAVELVATMGEEFGRPAETRRTAALRALGSAFIGLVENVDKVAAAYDLLKAAARSQGIELP